MNQWFGNSFCGLVHRLAYALTIDDANALWLDAGVRIDEELAAKLRREDDFPYQKVTRFSVGRIIGGK